LNRTLFKTTGITKKMKSLFWLITSLSFLGCSQKISSNKKTEGHSNIAILPFEMTLNFTKGQQAIIEEKDKAILSQTLSLNLQKKLHAMMVKYVAKHKLSITIQDPDETLNKLSANNTTFADLHNANKIAMLKILGVDALLDPKMIITQKGAAFSGLFPLPLAPITGGVGMLDVYNLHIDFGAAIQDLSADSALWKYKSSQWYQASNKIKKSKTEASNNFLAPLFLNMDDIFKAFLKKQPYQKL